MKIIIDTDPGVDDAMAIFYGHAAPEIELHGLTTVFGNAPVPLATRNALYLSEMLGEDIPVAQGADCPWNGLDYVPATHVHGPEGFGSVTGLKVQQKQLDEPAAAFLVRQAREHKGEIVVCAVAPLTNIAEAIRLDPEFASNLARIVIMGGAVDCSGNVTAHAEANIFKDPHAAAAVLSSGAEIVLVGLDVTMKTLCTAKDLDLLADAAPVTGTFIREIGQFYLDFYRRVEKQDGCGLHDSTALIACTHPDLFTMEQTGVSVVLSGEELGKTHRDPNQPVISVCLDIDADAVKALFMERMKTNP